MSACCYDYEPTDCYQQKFRKANKEHKCCECGASIAKGDVYETISYRYEGHWYFHKTCEKCADLRDSLGEVWCTYIGVLRDDYKMFCDEMNIGHWTADEQDWVYPENHLRLNG